MTRDPNPKEDVHVFLDHKIIITGFKYKGVTKLVDEVHNERQIFDFFLPVGEQEIFVKSSFTKGVYSFISNSTSVSIKADKSDLLFICAETKEIGSRYPTGGNVDTLLTPLVLYLKTEEEKGKALKEESINRAYFDERCKAALVAKP
jgi:hypothetical protein